MPPTCVPQLYTFYIIISYINIIFLYASLRLHLPSGHVAVALSAVLQHAVGVRYFVFHQSGEVPTASCGLCG